MPRLTAAEFHPEILRLFDQYVHGLIPRRVFLQNASAFAAGVGAAELLDMLNPRFAEAQQVRPDDRRLAAHNIEIEIAERLGQIALPSGAPGRGRRKGRGQARRRAGRA